MGNNFKNFDSKIPQLKVIYFIINTNNDMKRFIYNT